MVGNPKGGQGYRIFIIAQDSSPSGAAKGGRYDGESHIVQVVGSKMNSIDASENIGRSTKICRLVNSSR